MPTNKVSLKKPSKDSQYSEPLAIKLPNIANLPDIFNPNHPVTALFANHDSPEEAQRAIIDHMSNLQLAALYSLWSSPHFSYSSILELIKHTTELVKHRCRLYNIPYDSKNNFTPGSRPRTISID